MKNGNTNFYIKDGDLVDIGGASIAFNSSGESDFQFKKLDNQFFIQANSELLMSKIGDSHIDTFAVGSSAQLMVDFEYYSNGKLFLLKKMYSYAKVMYHTAMNTKENLPDALVLEVEKNGKSQELTVFGGSGYVSKYEAFDIDGTQLNIAFGDKPIQLPFSIYLKDFILERYAGSVSPSSYASKVVVIDQANGVRFNHRIFMNNILDYGGYRFFQSSYDQDEKGTILSVNHDFWGTWVSYLSYFLLGLGLLLTFLNKDSRFYTLRKEVKDIRYKRKAGLLSIVLILGFSSLSFGQNSVKHVSQEHADQFGHIVVQTFDGRFEPVHTMATEVSRKLSKNDEFLTHDGTALNAVELFLDLMINPEYWKNQRIIYIGNKTFQDKLGVQQDHVSFYDFFDDQGQYKLRNYAEEAFRKPRSQQNKFDKEIVKIDERLNVFVMIVEGQFLKIFPDQNAENHKWISWDEKEAFRPINGVLEVLNDDLQLKSFTYNNLFNAYLQSANPTFNHNDYARADKILTYISKIQKQLTAEEILPTEAKINTEIHYNKLNIFVKLKIVYAVLSVFLLLFAFVDNIRIKKSNFVKIGLNILIGLLAIGFVFHTYGMVLRWYLSGHAPWSNGYEALLLAAWGALFAGFLFVRNSKITLAATALISFFILMIAGFSNYDPQLTNLVPVLKSYWLIIHVACMTISYGFLGLGFVLGLLVMLIYLFQNKANQDRLGLLIKELTYINELNLSIGLALAVRLSKNPISKTQKLVA